MFSLFLTFSFSFLISNTTATIERMHHGGRPFLIFVDYQIPNLRNIDTMKVFNRTSEIYPDMDFGYLDCAIVGQTCQELGINPSPTIHLYNLKNRHALQFMNEISLYALSYFITDFTNMHPTIPFASHVDLSTSNFSSFIHRSKYSVIFFNDETDRMSQILIPTIDQVTGSFLPEDNISIGNVNCNKDIDFCLSLNITATPTIRIYKEGIQFDDYSQKTREYPYIMDFINTKCGTYRKSEAKVNMSRYLDPVVYQILNKTKAIQKSTFFEQLSFSSFRTPIYNYLDKLQTSNLSLEKERIEKSLIEMKDIQSHSKDFIIVLSWILNRLKE